MTPTELRTRAEHLQWCKDRAMEYVNAGDGDAAFASFTSDMRKHPETIGHSALMLGSQMFFSGQLVRRAEMTKWIQGFN